MPHAAASNQIALFDLQPAAADNAAPAPLAALPFQRSQEVEAARVRRILHVSLNTVHRLLRKGLIRGYSCGAGNSLQWRIEYDSVVAYCDRLRVENGVSDRAVGRLNARGRRRDADLLPFPMAETCSVAEAAARIGRSESSVTKMIECGRLVAYQVLIGHAGSPWRVHTPSVDRYLLSLHGQRTLAPRPSARRR